MTPQQEILAQKLRPLILAQIDRGGSYQNSLDALRYQHIAKAMPEKFQAVIDKAILETPQIKVDTP